MDSYDGVDFLWVRTPTYSGNGIGRVLNMMAYSLRVLLPAITRQLMRPAAIVGSSVHPFAALSGAILARRFGVPFVFEVRDLWPQTLIDFGRLKKGGLVARMLALLELWLYRRASRIIVLGPTAGDYIEQLGISRDKVTWIPNGVELDGYPCPAPKAPAAVFKLMYFGAHGQANGLENLIYAMAVLQAQSSAAHVHLEMIGDGPLKPALVKLAADVGATNITFLNPVPKQAIPDLAATADAFVLCVLDRPSLYRYGISMNKLFDYLAAARPIVISSGAVNNPVEESGSGVTVPPEQPEALADAIMALASLPHTQRLEMGRAGRAYAERYHSYEVLAARLSDVLDSLD